MVPKDRTGVHDHHSADQQEKILIQNSYGEKLVGVLHEAGSKEIVVVCHGFRSSKECIPMVNLAALLQKSGISGFSFDFAGNGESEGSFQYGNYRREVEDLRAVVQHFLEKRRVIAAIVGHSKGGNVVLLYASKYHDVCRVVNISGRFALETGIEGRLGKNFLERIRQDGFIDVYNRKGRFEYRVTEESLMDRLTTDVQASCKSIPNACRVLTVHGSMDKIVSLNNAFEFAKVIPNHVLHVIEGADHEYTMHQDDLASVVLDFVRADLIKTDNVTNQSTSVAQVNCRTHSRL